jgi:hypothetical protein
MKNFSLAAGSLRLALICLAVVMFGAGSARAEEPLRGEAMLVWGTNDPQSPDPKHVPVDEVLARKLSKSPYRWKHYFTVRKEIVEVPTGETKKGVTMSKHCVLDITNLGTNRVQVKLYGEGKLVSCNTEPFVDNWPLIFAGSAGNETAWLVVLRKVKPEEKKH